MTDRINDFFSPERLRKKWSRSTDARDKGMNPGQPNAFDPYKTILTDLRATVPGRFLEDVGALVNLLINDLEIQLAERFPAGQTPSGNPGELMAINQSIEQILVQIEELAESV